MTHHLMFDTPFLSLCLKLFCYMEKKRISIHDGRNCYLLINSCKNVRFLTLSRTLQKSQISHSYYSVYIYIWPQFHNHSPNPVHSQLKLRNILLSIFKTLHS